MATTFEAFPPPGLPPPTTLYPTTTTLTNQQRPPRHPTGSYGAVFIVLAVIVFVSAVACLLGRFCTRRAAHRPAKHHGHGHKYGGGGGGRPRDVDMGFGFGPRGGGGDFEVGFEGRLPKVKVAPSGHGRGQRPPENGQYGGRPMSHQLPMMESPRSFA